MNRVYSCLVIFISVMLLSSCVSEIVDNGDRIVELTFHAYARPDTKTVLAEGNEVHWLPGDEIAVTGSTEPFVASVSAPSSFAEFTGTAVEMSEYHAVYPYSLLQSWKGSVAHVLIPEVQTAVKGSFADELNVSVAMTSRKDMSLRFHNVLGYVRFTLPQEYDSIVSVSVTAEGGEALAGPAAIDCSEEQPVALPSDETSSVVTLMSPTALEAGAYYIAVIPGTYSSGLTLTFETSDHSEAVLEISRELQMNAGQIRNIGTISDLDFRKQEVNPVPDNEIWYTSSDGRLVTPYNKSYKEIFGAGLLSNIYVDGKGILQFDGAVTRVGVEAFRNKDYLTSIMLPDSVTEIGTYAFRSCDGLLEISLPSALTSIGEETFCYCTSLEEISIPESVETIGSNAFYACAGVLNVDCNIPEGAFVISAFHEVNIGENVRSIGKYAFRGNTGLKELVIPDNVQSVGEYAFADCGQMERVTIGSGVGIIENYAFYKTPGVLNVDCDISEGAFRTSAFHEVNIGENVHSIGKYAFRKNSGLKELVIPDNVQSVGEYAFADCGQMERV
ncbi:MAG: leucine-rich repeat domain-containing protein, partial [Bacteroidales bacterium]|nr:leucine-rich repeat domain-containing protein [Bacteroidales bacterium]